MPKHLIVGSGVRLTYFIDDDRSLDGEVTSLGLGYLAELLPLRPCYVRRSEEVASGWILRVLIQLALARIVCFRVCLLTKFGYIVGIDA